jgi:hypothetical protein
MAVGKWARTLVVSTGLGLGALALTVYGTGGFGASSAEAKLDKERHPHIRAALRELREAKLQLDKTDHDFGGHRKEAVRAVDVAIIQLEKALKFDRK